MNLRPLLVALAVATAVPVPASAAVDRNAIERQFQSWLVSNVWPEARAAGITRATFDRALGGVALDWDLPELQPPGEPVIPPKVEWQAEFGSPGAYFKESRLAALATAGRDLVTKWQKTLLAIEKRYGVPAPIIVALWGRESDFGRWGAPKSALRVIATQAFMGMRKEMFRPELIAALKIVQRGDVAPEKMRSTWAGALGQPQFTPSVFLKLAVDFDGDGRDDIWDSVPDSLASIANFLKAAGWNPERGWGVEVNVPASVACTLEGPEQGKPMAEWARLGVVQANGAPLPVRAGRTGYLLMPAGRFGPAFIVTENFYVLKQYNYSDLYALFVGHVADRIRDNRRFATAWQGVGGFSRGDVKRMQDELVAEGYDVGKADGLVGYKTRIAVGLWQQRKGQPQTCFPDARLIRSIH